MYLFYFLLIGISVIGQRLGVPLALSGGSRLQWFGCTENGSPVTLDSSGMLRLYNSIASLWIPICDTVQHYKGVSDSYFVISVNEQNEKVAVILCRGSQYPLTAPRPIVNHLPLKV